MNVLVKARIIKLWLLIKAEIQLIKTFPSASFSIQFLKMLNLTLSLIKIVRNKEMKSWKRIVNCIAHQYLQTL